MKTYLTKDIRNVGIVGHGGTGKTQLVSSLLFTAGMTPRWGKVAEGTTTTDWDEEEIGRKISIQTALAYAEWPCTLCSGDKVKINLIDLPGYSTFINEAKASLIGADAALITVDAHVGSQVTTEKVWDYCTEYDIPRAFVLTWMDRELSSFERAMESLEQVFGRNVVALQLPIGTERGFRGVIDLVSMKAHMYKPDGDGRPSIEEIPAALADEAKEAHEKLVEMIAEGDDELMNEFFREGTIPIHDLIPGVRKAIVAEKIFPVLMVSSLHNIGTASLLTFMADCFPHPDEHSQVGFNEPTGKGDRIERKYDDNQPVSVFVFKTLCRTASVRRRQARRAARPLPRLAVVGSAVRRRRRDPRPRRRGGRAAACAAAASAPPPSRSGRPSSPRPSSPSSSPYRSPTGTAPCSPSDPRSPHASTTLVGLDIGSTSVRAVEATRPRTARW